MSHHHERKEKRCLNCGTDLQGRFCHVCGQENIEPKETVSHLASHFFNDLTHFDSKAFTTLKDLVVKPGFLSSEYLKGRRVAYLHPVRLYFFTSAVFFLIFFSFLHPSNEIANVTINGKSVDEIARMDSASFAAFTARINKEDGKPALGMTREQFKNYLDTVAPVHGLYFTNAHYQSKEEYDSVLAKGIKKHNWIERQLIYKEIELNKKYHNDGKQIFNAVGSSLLHSLPQMLFISLPFFALILRLLYIRRKQFYYVSHLIFSLHLYIFLFIAMLISLCLSEVKADLQWGFLKVVTILIAIGMFVYVWLAMKRFYNQGWAKTLVKFLLLILLFLVLVLLLFVVMFFFSLFKI